MLFRSTRAGPWQPVDGQYGFCRKSDVLYVHLLQDFTGDTLSLPPVGPLNPQAAWQIIDGKKLKFTAKPDRTVIIAGIDRRTSPADTILAIRFDADVMAYALPWDGN